MQAVDAATAAKVPVGHVTQVTAPVFAVYAPREQLEHTVDPAAAENVPAGQKEHPELLAYVPARQLPEQAVEPSEETRPVAQSKQLEEAEALDADKYFPAAQRVQADVPADDVYRPATHDKHTTDPAKE